RGALDHLFPGVVFQGCGAAEGANSFGHGAETIRPVRSRYPVRRRDLSREVAGSQPDQTLQLPHFPGGEHPGGARLQATDVDRSEPGADEFGHWMTDGFE